MCACACECVCPNKYYYYYEFFLIVLPLSISVGDLVLIFFEEPRDNYVVFSIEPTLYFVHSESLSGLDLKHQASDGPKR